MHHEGTIRVHRMLGSQDAAFHVTFAPYAQDADAGAGGVRRFEELQQVGAFLARLKIDGEQARAALGQLAAGRSAVVPNVVLSEKRMRHEGLDSAVLSRRSNG